MARGAPVTVRYLSALGVGSLLRIATSKAAPMQFLFIILESMMYLVFAFLHHDGCSLRVGQYGMVTEDIVSCNYSLELHADEASVFAGAIHPFYDRSLSR
jgi:hypothetical protein